MLRRHVCVEHVAQARTWLNMLLYDAQPPAATHIGTCMWNNFLSLLAEHVFTCQLMLVAVKAASSSY
jgi:hypothetical protein